MNVSKNDYECEMSNEIFRETIDALGATNLVDE